MADRPLDGSAGQTEPQKTERIAAFDYLRSFGVLLVLLHHAALAYVTFGYLNPEDPTETSKPDCGQREVGRLRSCRLAQRHVLHAAPVLRLRSVRLAES